jgi:hypothetical protein
MLLPPGPAGLHIFKTAGGSTASKVAKMMANTHLAEKQRTLLAMKRFLDRHDEEATYAQRPVLAPVQQLYETYPQNQAASGEMVSEGGPQTLFSTQYVMEQGQPQPQPPLQPNTEYVPSAVEDDNVQEIASPSSQGQSSAFVMNLPFPQSSAVQTPTIMTEPNFMQPAQVILTQNSQEVPGRMAVGGDESGVGFFPEMIQNPVEMTDSQQHAASEIISDGFDNPPVRNTIEAPFSLAVPSVVRDRDSGMIEHMVAPLQQQTSNDLFVSQPAMASSSGPQTSGNVIHISFDTPITQASENEATMGTNEQVQTAPVLGSTTQVMSWPSQRPSQILPAALQQAIFGAASSGVTGNRIAGPGVSMGMGMGVGDLQAANGWPTAGSGTNEVVQDGGLSGDNQNGVSLGQDAQGNIFEKFAVAPGVQSVMYMPQQAHADALPPQASKQLPLQQSSQSFSPADELQTRVAQAQTFQPVLMTSPSKPLLQMTFYPEQQ